MSKKGHIFLDLDSTLILAEYKHKAEKHKKKIGKPYFYVYGEPGEKDSDFIVFLRDGLQDFLTYLFKNFKVSVWTAGTKDYAIDIVNNIIYKSNCKKTGRKLENILFRYHCKCSKRLSGKTKMLSLLDSDFMLDTDEDTIIIDDNFDDVYKYQKDRVINIPAFELFDNNGELLSSASDTDTAFDTIKKFLKKVGKNSYTIKDAVRDANTEYTTLAKND